MALVVLNSQQSISSFCSMVRRLCSSYTCSNFHSPILDKTFANSVIVPACRLSVIGQNCNNSTGQEFVVASRFLSSGCEMGDGRRPSSVRIPPIDKADRPELLRALEESLRSPFSVEPLCPSPNPLIIVISGPSGVGKDAVIKRLREVREGLHFVVTATSWAMRSGEVNGKDYNFVSKDAFLSMIERNELLEYALVYGEYKGIPKQQIRDFMLKGYDIVLRVDIRGAETLRMILGNSAVFIFLLAENELALVNRLIDRKTETTEALLVRIAMAREEVQHAKNFDYVVTNAKGQLQNAVKLVESIIDAEKAKVVQRSAVI